MTKNFKFWCPIEKAQDLDPTTGVEVMKLGGIASTSDEDSDGEFLDPQGFDITPLLQSGIVNWHHQAKGQPSAIIGEPVKGEIRKEGLYLETVLYPTSKMACEVWELAETFKKNSTTRRLGYSIEGKVVKRKSNNPKSPDYKKIIKAIITGVAITYQPKNAQTFANIIKGNVDDFDEDEEDEIEESMDTESGAAVTKESVDGVKKRKTLTKSETMEKLFCDLRGISIEKANKIYTLILNIAKMGKRTNVTEVDIEKAYDALGLSMEDNSDLSKAKETNEVDDTEEVEKAEEDDATNEVDDTEEVEKAEEDEAKKDVDDTEEVEKAEEDEAKKDVEKGYFAQLEKAISHSHTTNVKYIRALGVMVKDVAQKANAILDENAEMKEIIKAQDDTIGQMSERLEAYGSDVPTPRSMTSARAIERQFDKGENNEPLQNSSMISMSKNPSKVAQILDDACFSKGFDEEFSKACTSFEANKNLPQNIIARLKNEMGIEIVK